MVVKASDSQSVDLDSIPCYSHNTDFNNASHSFLLDAQHECREKAGKFFCLLKYPVGCSLPNFQNRPIILKPSYYGSVLGLFTFLVLDKHSLEVFSRLNWIRSPFEIIGISIRDNRSYLRSQECWIPFPWQARPHLAWHCKKMLRGGKQKNSVIQLCSAAQIVTVIKRHQKSILF